VVSRTSGDPQAVSIQTIDGKDYVAGFDPTRTGGATNYVGQNLKAFTPTFLVDVRSGR
jgi:hypothetical protein